MGRRHHRAENYRRQREETDEDRAQRHTVRQVCQRLGQGVPNGLPTLQRAVEAGRETSHRESRGAPSFIDALDEETLGQRGAGGLLTRKEWWSRGGRLPSNTTAASA